MNKYLSDVKKFYEAMGQSHFLTLRPYPLTKGRKELRIVLQDEELREYKAAENICDEADALVDQLYILMGTVLEHGLADKFDALWDEVQRSNMTKTLADEDIAPNVMRYEKEGVLVDVRKHGDRSVITRKVDGKVLKPLSYSPANLLSILDDKDINAN